MKREDRMTIAFNNMGIQRMPDAAAYLAEGVEGLVQAACDLGFLVFQLTTSGPQDPNWFRSVDAAAVRKRCE